MGRLHSRNHSEDETRVNTKDDSTSMALTLGCVAQRSPSSRVRCSTYSAHNAFGSSNCQGPERGPKTKRPTRTTSSRRRGAVYGGFLALPVNDIVMWRYSRTIAGTRGFGLLLETHRLRCGKKSPTERIRVTYLSIRQSNASP